MALTRGLAWAWAWAWAVVLGGCSFVLDPDELRADGLIDASEAGDAGDSGEAEARHDGAVGDAMAGDDGDGPRIVVSHSGMVSCTFEYRIGLTQCPERCGTWRYVVDASQSVGVGSFAWSFEATGGFAVTPSSAAGARVELSVQVPECLVGGTDVRPFSIVARLSADGAPAEPVLLPTIGVAQVTSCSGDDACPAPTVR